MSKQGQQQSHPQRNASFGRHQQQQHGAELVESRSTGQKRKATTEHQAFDDVQAQHHKRRRVPSGHQAPYGLPGPTMYQGSNGMTSTLHPDPRQRHPGQQRPPLPVCLSAGLEGRILPPLQHQPVSVAHQPPGSTTRSSSGRMQQQHKDQSSSGSDDDGDNDAEECLHKMRSDFMGHIIDGVPGGNVDTNSVFHAEINDLTNAFEAFIDTHQDVVLDFLKPAFEAFIDRNPEVVLEYLQPAFESFIKKIAMSFVSGDTE
ncbi:hypothetical protein LTR56_001601 [Elasticomyces elasticus]|nr:hypothetical protein LTR56_001601 [Elasticomyces elasticus]KAK3667347.1 hypothetical protein LTR22_001863 [Elasticomyces elasticus]KAK4932573.1 hypothetical protein LTR49_000997 [Elasticomyces elasticus]KAK5769595.1 hypothetical protein LTS12_000045 [Elasticomyces elasticus]